MDMLYRDKRLIGRCFVAFSLYLRRCIMLRTKLSFVLLLLHAHNSMHCSCTAARCALLHYALSVHTVPNALPCTAQCALLHASLLNASALLYGRWILTLCCSVHYSHTLLPCTLIRRGSCAYPCAVVRAGISGLAVRVVRGQSCAAMGRISVPDCHYAINCALNSGARVSCTAISVRATRSRLIGAVRARCGVRAVRTRLVSD
jgi:hypothetical protein